MVNAPEQAPELVTPMAQAQIQTLAHSFKDKAMYHRDDRPRFKPGWWLGPALLLAAPIWVGIFKLLFAWL